MLTSFQISSGELSVWHPSFRVISTASKSIPLKDWLSEEHVNMFFPVPAQPMDREEETDILLGTGCGVSTVETLIAFAEKYRSSLITDSILKNRKLGTRSLVRIARRLAMFPSDDDIRRMVNQSLLTEFLPPMERMNLEAVLEETGINKKPPMVCCLLCPFWHVDYLVDSVYQPSSTQPPFYGRRILFSLGPAVLARRPMRFPSPASTLPMTRQESLLISLTWNIFLTTAYKQA